MKIKKVDELYYTTVQIKLSTSNHHDHNSCIFKLIRDNLALLIIHMYI